MDFEILADDAVDGSFEPVWTCQGILRMPKKRPHKNKDGTLDYFVGTWQVPDYEKWSSIPGFPDFLWKPALLHPGLVRPMTAEERSAHVRASAVSTEAPRGMELLLLGETLSLRINGSVFALSPREYELISRTIEESPLSHKRAVLFLEAVKSKSPGGVDGFVDASALHHHRKGILSKTEEAAGRQARVLLGEAFRSKGGAFLFDKSVLPVRGGP